MKHIMRIACKFLNVISANFSFQCPDFKSMDPKKCHYKGRAYNMNESLNATGICAPGCFCSDQNDSSAKFVCAALGCGQNIQPEPTAQIYEHEGDCCPTYVRKFNHFIRSKFHMRITFRLIISRQRFTEPA